MADVIKRTNVIVQYQADLKNLEQGNAKARKTVSGFSSFAKQAVGAGVGFIGADIFLNAANNIGAIIQRSGQLALQNEKTKVSFETMLGSAEKAEDVLAQLRKFAEGTPLQEAEIFQAGQALLGFGENADNLTPVLNRLSDVSAGTGKNFNELAVIYGKARVQGTLFGEDINQLTNAGIPVIDEFAKILGVGTSEVKKLASEGKIGFPVLEKAFINMTSAGARFYNMTANQAKTVGGRISTLKDTFDKLLLTLGNLFLPMLGSLVGGFQKLATIAVDVVNFLFRIDTSTKSAVDSTRLLQLEFNSEIEVLKKLNPANKERGTLIAEINEKYGEYLPKLLTEKSSLDEITKAQTFANQAFKEKLVLLAFEEEFNKLKKEQVSLIQGAAKAELSALETREKLARNDLLKDNGRFIDALENEVALNESLADINQNKATELEEQSKKVRTVYEQMAIDLGTTLDAISARFTKKISPEEQNAGPEGKVKALKTRLEQLKEQLAEAEKALNNLAGRANTPEFADAAKNVANLRRMYALWSEEIDKAVQGVFLLDDTLKFFDDRFEEDFPIATGLAPTPAQGPGPEIMQKFQEDQLAASKRINIEFETEREKEVRLITEHYAELLTLARKYRLGKEVEDRLRAERDKELALFTVQDIKAQGINLIQTTFETLSQIADAQSSRLDEALGRQQSRVDKYKELAERGSSEQLQIEEDRLKRMEDARRKSVERSRVIAQAQMLINQALAASETIKFIAQAFGQGGGLFGIVTGTLAAAALALTIGSTIGQLSGAFGDIPAFAEGIERVGGRGRRKQDNILAKVSVDERIVPADINDQLYGLPNKQLPHAVAALMALPYIFGTLRKIEAQGEQLAGLREDMSNLIRVTSETGMYLEVSERGLYAGYQRGRMRDRRERALA
jgi:tape measure domain-containing protein